MSAREGSALPASLRGFPGAILRLDADGSVLDSNGQLERALGRAVLGQRFADLLDADSSLDKWRQVLAGVTASSDGMVCELVLCGEHTLDEPRAFSVLSEQGAGTMWLVEHPRDARLDDLRQRVTGVNSELANTQRELLKERGRLAHTLAQLEAQHRTLVATSDELARSNRALDEFAHVVSHDLKAPLRGIDHAAQWIAEDLGADLPSEVARHVGTLRRQVGRMRALIEGILTYARAGRGHETIARVDLETMLRDVVALLGVAPPVVTWDAPLPVIETPRAPLKQILQNLVDNAVKHGARVEPRVHVGVRDEGDRIEVAVRDNGPGIPPSLHERIWTLFHTLEPSDSPERTGIGLAVVRRLVEAHGGRAWVESREGEGATFRFTWPARAGHRDPAA